MLELGCRQYIVYGTPTLLTKEMFTEKIRIIKKQLNKIPTSHRKHAKDTVINTIVNICKDLPNDDNFTPPDTLPVKQSVHNPALETLNYLPHSTN